MKKPNKIINISKNDISNLLNGKNSLEKENSKIHKNKEDKIYIEKYEYIFQNNNQNVQKNEKYHKYIYKSKINKNKKIKKVPKKEVLPIRERIIYHVTKKYLNKKVSEEKKEKNYYKISPYNFKYFYKPENRKNMYKSLSNPSYKNNKDVNCMESNFIKLNKDANIYTSNATYIKNKKMLLFNKFNYDNNSYKPDRAKLFDMTRIPNFPNKNSFLYKTTNFRAGHLIANDNNSSIGTIGNSYLNNLSLLNNNKLENSLQFININNINNTTVIPNSYIDNSFQNNKRHPPSDSLYKHLMEKKNETLENFFKNNEYNQEENENENESINKLSKIKKLYYKQIEKNNFEKSGYSALLSKRKNNLGQPLLFPKVFSANISFENHSQKERFEKISESFYNLKELIENNKEEDKKIKNLNELDYIYEFAINKKIDKKYLTIINLNNFYNFLHEKKLPLDLSKSLKENIILALNYDRNKEKEKKKILMKKLNFKKIEKRRLSSKNKNESNNEFKPLLLDLERQKKINKEDIFSKSDRVIIRNELKKEIDSIKKEVLNKQKIMQNIRKENNERKNINKKELKDSKIQDFLNKSNLEKNHDKINEKIFDSNERLYYTWYKNKNSSNINNFIKKSKLTELYFYNRTTQKLNQNKLENDLFYFNK